MGADSIKSEFTENNFVKIRKITQISLDTSPLTNINTDNLVDF